MNAERLMLASGVLVFLLTLSWVRKRDLREKYAVVWVCLAAMLLLVGLFPQALMSVADMFHLSYPSAVLFVTLTAIYMFSFTVSVSLSGLYRRNVRLVQEIAMLEYRIRQLEAAPGREKPTESA